MCLCWFWMVFTQTNFIEADWKVERLTVRSSFWWREALKSWNKQGQWALRQGAALMRPTVSCWSGFPVVAFVGNKLRSKALLSCRPRCWSGLLATQKFTFQMSRAGGSWTVGLSRDEKVAVDSVSLRLVHGHMSQSKASCRVVCVQPAAENFLPGRKKIPYRRLHTKNSAGCFRLLTRVCTPISKKQSPQPPSSRLN
jgi:hypothetical protein